MANAKHVDLVKEGRVAIARWRAKNPDIILDLTDADLHSLDLRGANLRRSLLLGANLEGADLSSAALAGADLTRANLAHAKLVHADLSGCRVFKAAFEDADLSHATLQRADLTSADFASSTLHDADLRSAVLRSANLQHADLTNANLGQTDCFQADVTHARFGCTNLVNLDLSTVIGLPHAVHVAPSSVGIDTLLSSRGDIDPEFLLGCGVPAALMEATASLFEHPFATLSCFILCSESDKPFAEMLHKHLQAKGLRCWLNVQTSETEAAQDDPSSTHWAASDRLLLVVSRHSLKSDWIDASLNAAFDSEKRLSADRKSQSQVLFPVNLDGFLFSGEWKHAFEKILAGRLTADFTGWRRNREKFDQELQEVLQALPANQSQQRKPGLFSRRS